MRKLAASCIAVFVVASTWMVVSNFRWLDETGFAALFDASRAEEAMDRKVREHRAFREVLHAAVERLRAGRCRLVQAAESIREYCVESYPWYLELLEHHRPGASLLEKLARGFIEHFEIEWMDGNPRKLPPEFLPKLYDEFDETFRPLERPLLLAATSVDRAPAGRPASRA